MQKKLKLMKITAKMKADLEVNNKKKNTIKANVNNLSVVKQNCHGAISSGGGRRHRLPKEKKKQFREAKLKTEKKQK